MKGKDFFRTFGRFFFFLFYFFCKIIIFNRRLFYFHPKLKPETCDCGLCCIFALLTSNGGFVKMLRKMLHKSVLSPGKRTPARKRCIGSDVIRWFSKVSLGGWAGNRHHHYQTRGLVGMCAVLGITSQCRQKKHSSHSKALAMLPPNRTVRLCFPL